MSKHLPILRDMFPGQVMLGVEQIAQCLNLSKGHIYNLSSARRLPFKIDGSVEGRLRVSIVELADYLDRSLLSQPSANDEPPAAIAAPAKRGPGRPRGSTTQRLAKAAFQAALRAEIVMFEARAMLLEINQRLNADEPKGPSADPAEADLSRIVLVAEVQSALARLHDAYVSTAPEPDDAEDYEDELDD